MKKEEFSGIDYFIGIVVWLIIINVISNQSACAAYQRCDSGDLVMSAILGIGFMGPSWVAMVFSSIVFRKK